MNYDPQLPLYLGAFVGALIIGVITYLEYRRTKRQSGSTKVIPVDPIPAPPPELSCLVRGLIKSMKETPKEWERNEFALYGAMWTHTSTGVWVSHKDGWNPYPGSIDYSSIFTNAGTIAPHEKQPLISAFLIYLEGPDKARQEDLAKIVEEVAALESARLAAPFERLGCPEVSDISSR